MRNHLPKASITLAVVGIFSFGTLCAIAGAAEPSATQPAPADRSAAAGPDAVRLTFLGDQISADEAAIAAINRALGTADYKSSLAAQKAGDMMLNNERMDRHGGGPVPWQEFYGRTARAFIVHDAIITRHAYIRTSRDVEPPPQFSYIYRANSNEAAAARAEIAAIGDKADALLARKRELETDISYLWATIAFESISNRDIPMRPLYRDQLQAGSARSGDNAPAQARLATIRAAVLYIRSVEHAVTTLADQLESNQQGVYISLRDALAKDEQRLQEANAGFAETPGVDSAEVGQTMEVVSQAKRIQALCKDLCEANRKAADADAAGEERRKQLCRGTLQDSLFTFAETVAQLDDTVMKMAQDWNIQTQPGIKSQDQLPAVDMPSPTVVAPNPMPVVAEAPAQAPSPVPMPVAQPVQDPAMEPPQGLDAVEARLVSELVIHNPASFHYLAEPGHELNQESVLTVIKAYPQKYQQLVLTNGKPGVELAAGTINYNVIPITSRQFVGYAIGKINRGDSIVLQYVSGKWKSFGHIASESPDSERPERGDTCRVAICDMSGGERLGQVLQVVPGDTHAKPFTWTADRDSSQVILRINSDDADFSAHPDKGVKYKLWIVPGGGLSSQGEAAPPQGEVFAAAPMADAAVSMTAYPAVQPMAALAAPEQTSEEGQLQQLVSPIALYPDPLLAQVLTASTYPQQVQEAEQWLQAHPSASQAGIDAQPWDASIKALVCYPTAIQYMASNMPWTESLGSAFTSNQASVNASIQDLRAQAAAVGSLKSTAQQAVLQQDSEIHIEPTNPNVVYVPTYDPAVVYEQPALIVYSEQYVLGPWLNLGFDWVGGRIYVGDWHAGWRWDHHRWYWHTHWHHDIHYWTRSVHWGRAPHVTHFAVHRAFRGRAFRTVPMRHLVLRREAKK